MAGICDSRVAIITGAGGGLGAAHAKAFAAEGVIIAATDQVEPEGEDDTNPDVNDRRPQ